MYIRILCNIYVYVRRRKSGKTIISCGLTAASVSGNYGRIVQIAMHWKTTKQNTSVHTKSAKRKAGERKNKNCWRPSIGGLRPRVTN